MIVRALIVAAGGAMATLVAACGGGSSVPTDGPSARPVASATCSPVSYGGPGRPRFLIVNNYSYQGPHGSHGVQAAQAIKMVLADRGWRAGPYTIGMQACEETSARTGQPSAVKCRRNAQAFAEDPSVLGVIGPLSSFCAANMLATLNRAPGGPLADISGSNTYVGLTRAAAGTGPGEPQRYFPTGRRSYARLAPTDDVQGAAMRWSRAGWASVAPTCSMIARHTGPRSPGRSAPPRAGWASTWSGAPSSRQRRATTGRCPVAFAPPTPPPYSSPATL